MCVFALLISSCVGTTSPHQNTSRHEVRYNGQDSVVYMENQNSNGSVSSFFMNYMMFRTLFGSGGYNNVNGYYQGHQNDFSNQSRYYSYRPRYTSTNRVTPTKTYSSPNRSTSKTYSSPSRSSTPSRTYSSPTRSSSTRSYSSPSRSSSSSSSSSRSYSSPSRSSSRR